jgi:hypothetical protein
MLEDFPGFSVTLRPTSGTVCGRDIAVVVSAHGLRGANMEPDELAVTFGGRVRVICVEKRLHRRRG